MMVSIATLDKQEQQQQQQQQQHFKICKTTQNGSQQEGACGAGSAAKKVTDSSHILGGEILVKNNSNSSNETVIARLDLETTKASTLSVVGRGDNGELLESTPTIKETSSTTSNIRAKSGANHRTFKSIFLNFAGQHLHLFTNHHHQQQQQQQQDSHNQLHSSSSDSEQPMLPQVSSKPPATRKTSDSNNFLVSFAQKCFHLNFSPGHATAASAATSAADDDGETTTNGRDCHSCPVTPLKGGGGQGGEQEPVSRRPRSNGCFLGSTREAELSGGGGGRGGNRKLSSKKAAAPTESGESGSSVSSKSRPSVRFVVESPQTSEATQSQVGDASSECASAPLKARRANEDKDKQQLPVSADAEKNSDGKTTTSSERGGASSKQRYFAINKHLKQLKQHARQVKFTDCGVQTTASPQQPPPLGQTTDAEQVFIEDDSERAKLVEELFRLPPPLSPLSANSGDAFRGQPTDVLAQAAAASTSVDSAQPLGMNSSQFRANGYRLIDYICNYLDTIRQRRVTPINIEPGYLKALIEPTAPERGESFSQIMRDFEEKIMCGITHWQHPHFHAYFPAGNAYPSILADMLSDALGCVGFSWAASPAYTELEIIMLDWMGKMIGLPDEFLCLSSSSSSSSSSADGSAVAPGAAAAAADPSLGAATSGCAGGDKDKESKSRGGGVIQGSASECVLVNMLAARHWAMDKLRKKYPGTQDGILLTKLIGYCSKEAHSCVEKAAMIGFINMRALETDERHSLRGETLRKALEADLAAGLEPFIVCATLGTTSCVSFDNLRELGEVCRDHDNLWLHVDAAYAGSALICPEFKYLIDGIELATSFNMNPNKWMLINFDCSLMWVKDRFKLTRAFVVDPLYLQHSFSDQAIDYRHWGIPLSRRFRALKLWFTIRNYGIDGLRAYIRNHVKLAKLFESLIRQDKRFTITNDVTLGLVCFRLVGSNALNQRLLSMLNASGKLHMVPASLNGRYIIRFCVCDQNARAEDIEYAYECIAQMATELFELIKAGKERIRAISQQNTIDVSSISLHTQQSASADLVTGAGEVVATSGPASNQQVVGVGGATVAPTQLTDTPRQDSRAATTNTLQPHAAGSPKLLTKQVSIHAPHQQQQQQQLAQAQQQAQMQRPVSGMSSANLEDLEAEVPIDSLASIEGLDLDEEDELYEEFLEGLDDVDDDEDTLELDRTRDTNVANDTTDERAKMSAEQLRSIISDSISPIQRGRLSRASGSMRSNSTLRANASKGNAGGGGGGGVGGHSDEADEAADELVKLADKRNRMSLRYKREFFVRVVSDPRVYRASISGDINAHAASMSSLGPQQQTTAPSGAKVTAAAAAAATQKLPPSEPASAEATEKS